MKVLLVGGGGREHALGWALAQSAARPHLYIAPGNAGLVEIGDCLNLAADDIQGLTAWAADARPDLTVIGPEAPLCAGLADCLLALDLTVFGPTQAAARLEGSKVFAKEIMQAAGVPTARGQSFSDSNEAVAYARALGAPMVIKADGLAAGKGVTVCTSLAQAEEAINGCLIEGRFGGAGARVLVEECLMGEEVSVLALVDGARLAVLASSQDHKRALEGDRGPNTGGMGAYSPAPAFTPEIEAQVVRKILHPTVAELARRGIPYRGVLYAGLMLTAVGPKVLEFNCRFGDPETQAVLRRWDGDVLDTLLACAKGRLDPSTIRWRPEAAMCVVLAAGGYPGAYRIGDPISGLEDAGALSEVVLFHAGTRRAGDAVVTAGGRVLGVTALGATLRDAALRAYAACDRIRFTDRTLRWDIGWRALET